MDTTLEIESFEKQIGDLIVHKGQREGCLTDLQQRTTKLAKAAADQQEELSALSTNHKIRRHDAAEREQAAAERVKRLRHEIECIEIQVSEMSLQILPAVNTPDTSSRPNVAVGNNAICYQAVQRVFRNAVVSFLRGRLPRVFPADHTQRLRKLFREQWDRAEQNATQSRQIGGTNTVVRDDYDLLGTNHFFSIFESFFDKLFSLEADPAQTPLRPVKSKLLGNLKTIKDGRDPLSHPVEEEVSFEEAHHLLIEAKQVLSWLGCDKQATEISGLAAKLEGADAEPPSIVRRLPSEDSIYLEFVGRGTTLADLTKCFENTDSRRCLLAGDGGKGKSAIAYRFAQTLSSEPGRFQLIVWLSAKRRKFQEGTTSAIDIPDFTNAAEAIDRLLTEYGATGSDLNMSVENKKCLLTEFLNTLPAFIIADDIDTVLDDHEVVSLFTYEIPHTKSAVLLTSRRDIPGIRSIAIKEFDNEEACHFIQSRVKLYGLDGNVFSNSVMANIARVTDGSPLYMEDLLRLTKIVDVESAIRMWQEKKGDEARKYALARELEGLTQDAKRVLIAAAIADDPISFAELENILRIPEHRLYSTLSELQTLFLVPKPRLVQGEQRFQINLNTKNLVRIVEASSDLYGRIERETKALAGKLPDAGHGVVSSLIRQAFLRLNTGKLSESEMILQDALAKYPASTDLHGFLGFVYKRIGRTADARNQFEAASRLSGSKQEMYMHWIKMEVSGKEWSKAIKAADKALKAHPKFYEAVERKVYAQRQAGFDLHRGLHREKAEKIWSDAIEEVKLSMRAPEELEIGARQLSASMFYSVVICLDMLGRIPERDMWMDRWEKEHPDDVRVVQQKDFLDEKDAVRNKRLGYNFTTAPATRF